MEGKRRSRKVKEKTQLELVMERVDAQCRGCHPTTPLDCIGSCHVWRLRNEIKQLRGIITQQDYHDALLNTLKNKRRLKILELLSQSAFSVQHLQEELKGLGFSHSQETILSEYVEPLMTTGLISENSGHFKATTFGFEINQLFKGLGSFESVLPPHSECYEEKVIEALFEAPKAYDELKLLVPSESLKRVMARLLETNLVTKNGDNNYIYYFRTKRPMGLERLSSTEKRVYEGIPDEGVTGEQLAEKTGITLRRTYKYIRKLRGKKLVFKRKRPKTFDLTEEGVKIAVFLGWLCAVVKEFAEVSVGLATGTLEGAQQVSVSSGESKEKPLPVLVKHGN
jgi:predicted transcriptional regulator/DNA-binding HxlR family transcriptional regulator